MILIIAIIINIIMIAIVTVNVVITGIIMKTCLFFIIAVFIYVIINDVTVFGFVLSLNQSDSPRTLAFIFFSIFRKRFLTFSSCQPIFQLYWEEEPSPAGQDGSLLYVRSLSTDLSSERRILSISQNAPPRNSQFSLFRSRESSFSFFFSWEIIMIQTPENNPV